jgi:hypothetical protein
VGHGLPADHVFLVAQQPLPTGKGHSRILTAFDRIIRTIRQRQPRWKPGG